MIALDEPEQAVGWADRKPWPRRDRVREALLADAMHLSGQEHEAHAIYARLCAALPGGLGSLLGQGRQGFLHCRWTTWASCRWTTDGR